MSLHCGRKWEQLEETQVNMWSTWKKNQTLSSSISSWHRWVHLCNPNPFNGTHLYNIAHRPNSRHNLTVLKIILGLHHCQWEQQEELGRQKESFSQQSPHTSLASLEITRLSCAIWFWKSSFKRRCSSVINVLSMWKRRWQSASVKVGTFNFSTPSLTSWFSVYLLVEWKRL